MNVPPDPTPCGSCGAPVLFARMRSGALSPFDAEPNEAGNFLLTFRRSRGELEGAYVGPDERENIAAQGRNFYMTHFATCPNADRHRRR